MIQAMQNEQELELTVEMDTDDHGTTKGLAPGGHRPRPRRLHDEKEEARRALTDDEFRTKLIGRPVTYDEILALIEAEIRALDEIQRRELLETTKRKETAREFALIDEELTREFARIVEKTREQSAVELAAKEPNRRRMETTTSSSVSHESGVRLESSGNPPSSVDGTVESSSGHGCSEGDEGSAGTRDAATKGTARNVSFRENLSAAEATASSSRIPPHRKHQMEELVVEDVDTFYEDQTKSPKKKKEKEEEKRKRTTPTHDHVTYVVSYDHPFGCGSRRKPNRNPLHSNRAKVKSWSPPTAKYIGPAPQGKTTMTYIVNHDQQPEVVTGSGRDAVDRLREIPIRRDDEEEVSEPQKHTASGEATVAATTTPAPSKHESEARSWNRSLPGQEISCSGSAQLSTPGAKVPATKVSNEQQTASIESSEERESKDQKGRREVDGQSAQEASAAVDASWKSSELVAYMLTHYDSKYPVSTERLDLMTTVSKATEVVLPQAKTSNNAARGNEVGIEKPTDGEELVAISGQRLAIAAVASPLHELHTEETSTTVTETLNRVNSNSITYVVNYDSDSLRIPKRVRDEMNKESVSKKPEPVLDLPSCDAFSKELQKEADKGTESVTYIVSYSVPDKSAAGKQPVSTSPTATAVPIRKSPAGHEVDETRQELTIVVEHPQIGLSAEERKAKNSVEKPASQLLTIADDQPQINEKADANPKPMKKPQTTVSSSSIESHIKRDNADQSRSIIYVINYEDDSLKLPGKTKSERKKEEEKKRKKKKKGRKKVSNQRGAKPDSPSDDVTGADESNAGQKDASFESESLTFVVSHSVPASASSTKESDEEETAMLRPAVDLSTAEAERGKPPFQQLTISVERSVETGKGPETGSADTSLPLSIRNEQLKFVSEMKARTLESTSEFKRTDPQRPRRSASEILTFIVTYEEPEIITTEMRKDKTKPGKVKISTTPETPGGQERIFAGVPTPSLETDRKTVNTESLTYIVEHIDKPRTKEGIHEEGEKKGRDWWGVKKSNERIDLSTEGKTNIESEVQNLPETCTYIVTCDYLASAAEAKLWPFSRKTPSCRVDRKVSGEKKMSLLGKKNQLKVAKSKTEARETSSIAAAHVGLPGVSTGSETKQRFPAEEFRVVEEPIAGELTAEAVESEEKRFSTKGKSRLDIGAKLPGGHRRTSEKEKTRNAKSTGTGKEDADEEKHQNEREAEKHRRGEGKIGGGGGEEEETVTYIVNYDRPFASRTIETPVPTERHTGTDTNADAKQQQQQQQFDQCILVPLQQDNSPEDGFYSAEVERFVRRSPPSATRRPSSVAAAAAVVVVAVDIGTTFSGYAFGFGGDRRATEAVHVMRKWEGGDPGAVDHKTPTILLLTPDGRFHSFGFSARDFYHDLSPKEANRWLYFERFKMALHSSAEGLCLSSRLSAANGQSVPAVEVFSQALRFFRDRVLQEIGDQDSTGAGGGGGGGGGGGCGGGERGIRWVITVPVIWTKEAKQLMRLAAYKAGIASPDNPDQLTIALEPEAAQMFVRKQRLDQLGPVDGAAATAAAAAAAKGSSRPHLRRSGPTQTSAAVNESTIGSGNRYMVVDCGGGSTDISVHEIQSTGGALRDLQGAVGAPFGSVAVDQEFEKLLVAIFGFDFIDAFKTKRPAGWVDLLMAFESRKRAANPHNAKPLNVSLPFSFIDYHKKFRNCPPDLAIRKFGDDGIRWSSHGMLRLMPDAMRRLFHPAIEGITEAITKTLKDNSGTDRGMKFLFLVGGFAESAMLQLAIRKRFGHLVKIVLPSDASISVLKGAVHLGLDDGQTATTAAAAAPRKSRMSYGVAVLNRFIRGQHPGSKVVARADDKWCADVFDAFVCADQPVAVGDSVVRRYALLLPDDAGDDVSASVLIGVYSSEANDVKYVTDEGVTRCGTLELPNDEGVRGREVQVRMTFGHKEVEVTAVDLKTRKSVNFATDFHSR